MAVRERDIEPEADRASGCAHPRETYDLIGHREAETRIIQAMNNQKLHHAWLLTGPKGIGKATLAYRFIRKLLGGQSRLETALDISPEDPVAQRVQSLGHADMVVLRRPYDHKTKKLRSEIPVSEARRVGEFFSRKPAEGGWRVCLVDSMDEMNRNAENAILKVLEEPPEKTILILISSNPGRLLPTIRSRCMHLQLRAVGQDEIIPWLDNHGVKDTAQLSLIALLSRGSPGRAMALSQNYDDVVSPLVSYFRSLDRGNPSIDLKLSHKLSAQNAGEARALFWDALRDILSFQIRCNETGEWPNALGNPLETIRSSDFLIKQWENIVHMQNRESAINMDKKTVMQTVLTALRAA